MRISWSLLTVDSSSPTTNWGVCRMTITQTTSCPVSSPSHRFSVSNSWIERKGTDETYRSKCEQQWTVPKNIVTPWPTRKPALKVHIPTKHSTATTQPLASSDTEYHNKTLNNNYPATKTREWAETREWAVTLARGGSKWSCESRTRSLYYMM